MTEEEKIETIIAVIDELKSKIYELACKYYCYDYRVIVFYNSNSYLILDKLMTPDELPKIDELIDDFVSYYDVEPEDYEETMILYKKLLNTLQTK
jgi:hypothetical protein